MCIPYALLLFPSQNPLDPHSHNQFVKEQILLLVTPLGFGIFPWRFPTITLRIFLVFFMLVTLLFHFISIYMITRMLLCKAYNLWRWSFCTFLHYYIKNLKSSCYFNLRFNVQKYFVVPTRFTYVIYMDLRPNNDYFPVHY